MAEVSVSAPELVRVAAPDRLIRVDALEAVVDETIVYRPVPATVVGKEESVATINPDPILGRSFALRLRRIALADVEFGRNSRAHNVTRLDRGNKAKDARWLPQSPIYSSVVAV